MQIETLKIKAGNDYTVINQADFDPAAHELYEPEPASDQTGDQEIDPASDQKNDQVTDPPKTKTDRKPKQS